MAMGLVTGIPWEIVGILSQVVHLEAFTLPSPTDHQPLHRKTPKEARGCVPIYSTWPVVPNNS